MICAWYILALQPFWNTTSSFWKSLDITTPDTELNYTYPDFIDIKPDSEGLKGLAHNIKSLYRPALPIGIGNSGTYYQWTARIRCNKYELGGRSFIIYFFLGSAPEDRAQWKTSTNRIGVFATFVNSAADQCENCRDNAENLVEGFVHLDDGLSKHANLASFEPEVVKPYLRDNLRWGVVVSLINTLHY